MPTHFFGGQISILACDSLLIAQFRGQTTLNLEKIRGQTLNMEKIRGQTLNLEKIRGQIVLHHTRQKFFLFILLQN